MPELFQMAAESPELSWRVLVLRLALATGAGLVVAAVYAVSQRRPSGLVLPMFTTLVLLTMLVAMTTIVIGDSVARAFGLVGALSIVRFRTVVEDTRDTSFVIFAVVVGMALGAGNFVVCVVGVPLVALVAVGLGAVDGAAARAGERRLEVRVGTGRDPEALLKPVLEEHLKSWTLVAAVSARQGAALDVVYRVRLRGQSGVVSLIKAIQAIEGVQNVELKENA